jgi:hypothetical protein
MGSRIERERERERSLKAVRIFWDSWVGEMTIMSLLKFWV